MNLEFTEEGITKAAQQVWDYGKKYKVWAFHAPMGAGKTTLIHVLCTDVLQVQDAVSSPTFAIINEYKSPLAGIIYHMDWYRLKDEEEAAQAGVDDCLNSGNICLIEWPEKAALLLPDNRVNIYIELVDECTRLIKTKVNS